MKVRNSRGCLESNYWSPTFFGQECLNEVNSTAQSRNSVNGCELFAFFNHQFEKETAYVLPWECQSSLKLLTRRYTSVQKMGVKEILALKCLSLFFNFCSTQIFYFNFRTHYSLALIKSRKQLTFDMWKNWAKKGGVKVILASSITYFSLKTCRNMKLEKKLDRAVKVH